MGMTAAASEVQHSCGIFDGKSTVVFADMHDGDEKEVTISGYDHETKMANMTIKPHGSDQKWVVNTKMDCKNWKATVDFNVPGKDDHPPVPIQASCANSVSPTSNGDPSVDPFGRTKKVCMFTDDSGELVDDPTFPLNQWVAETHEMYLPLDCPESLQAVFADMHDGDK